MCKSCVLLEMQMIGLVRLKISRTNTDDCTNAAIKKHPGLWFLKTAECNFGYRHTLSFCVASSFHSTDCMTFTAFKYEHFVIECYTPTNALSIQ